MEQEMIKEFLTHLWGLWEHLWKYIREPGMGGSEILSYIVQIREQS
jgi:hypothetical protein